MADKGHPKLKAKVLDMITKLRLEAKILNDAKTGKNPMGLGGVALIKSA